MHCIPLTAAQEEFIRFQNLNDLQEKKFYMRDFVRFFEDMERTIEKTSQPCGRKDCVCRQWYGKYHVDVEEDEAELIRQIVYEEHIGYYPMKMIERMFMRLQDQLDRKV